MSINLTQEFVFETDSINSLEKMLQTVVSILFKEKPGDYSQLYMSKRKNEHFYDGSRYGDIDLLDKTEISKGAKLAYLYICTIGNYRSDIRGTDNIFDSYSKLTNATITEVKQADRKKFWDSCGDGFNGTFNMYDGSVGLGFRLSHYSSAWDELHVSFCHIYYGK